MTVQPFHPPTAAPFPSLEELAVVEQQVARFARSNLLPAQVRGKEADVFTLLMVARDLGLPATSGLFKVHVVEGRPTLAADLMLALGLSHGHDLWIAETTAERAVAKGKRRGSDRVTEIDYTIADAEAAGLTGKANWKANRKAMLRARAISALCRVVIPDVLGGIAASTEEALDDLTVAAAVPAEQAAAALAAAVAPTFVAPTEEPTVVDGETVPAEPSALDRVTPYLERIETSGDEESLRALWNDADDAGLLDLEYPVEGVGETTLRATITALVLEARGGQA